jgi:hypothetical protein
LKRRGYRLRIFDEQMHGSGSRAGDHSNAKLGQRRFV